MGLASDVEAISVIIPIYNVEAYLKRCVESVLNQTYKNLEIILIDDESPDNCPKLCDEFAKNDKRIKVIHKKNGGLSDARNVGTDLATGNYIIYVDSDDWISSDALELLYSALKKHNADIAECSYLNVYSHGAKYETSANGSIVVVDARQAIFDMYSYKFFLPVAWNKLYKREIVGNIRYPVGKYHEDEFTTYKFFMASERIVYIDVCKYYYNKERTDSITGDRFSVRNLDAVEAFHERLHEVLNMEYEELYNVAIDNYAYILFYSLYKCFLYGIKGNRIIEIINMARSDYEIIKLKKLSIAKKYDMLFKILLGKLL